MMIVSQAKRTYSPLPAYTDDDDDDDDGDDDDKNENENWEDGPEHETVPDITPNDISIPPIWEAISMQAHEAFALRDAYIVCADIKQHPPEKYAEKAQAIFRILFYADEIEKVFKSNIERYYKGLLPETFQQYIDQQKRMDLVAIPRLPLLEQYRTYMESPSARYLEYDYGIKMPRKRYRLHFWESKAADAQRATVQALEAFQSRLQKSLSENERGLERLTHDPAALARECIKPIDGFINRHLRDAMVQLDGSGETSVISMRTTSLYVWLLPQLTNAGDCRICAICGLPFQLGSQKTKMYCSRHDSTEWDSYRRAINRRRKAASARESNTKTNSEGVK